MKFTKRFNPFSESFRRDLREMWDIIEEYARTKDFYQTMAIREIPEPNVPTFILAKITGARLINGNDGDDQTGSPPPGDGDESRNLWMYKWESFTNSANNSDNYTRFALNGAEFDNNGSGEESYGVTVQANNPTISLLPIGNNGEVKPVVLMYALPAPVSLTPTLVNSSGDVAGTTTIQSSYFFSAGNDVDVTC